WWLLGLIPRSRDVFLTSLLVLSLSTVESAGSILPQQSLLSRSLLRAKVGQGLGP
ncbi:hypothetical protein K0M31_002185, partial [Melipona bicolor]